MYFKQISVSSVYFKGILSVSAACRRRRQLDFPACAPKFRGSIAEGTGEFVVRERGGTGKRDRAANGIGR